MDYKDFIKKYSGVNAKFIDDFFSLYNENTLRTDMVINLDVVVKYLQSRKTHLLDTLRESYIEDTDYKHVYSNKTSPGPGRKSHVILLTPDCFKLLCMQSRSKNAQQVRQYFLEVENTLIEYRDVIEEAMMKRIEAVESNLKPIVPANIKGAVYVLRASDIATNVYKIGRTKNLKQRMTQYMSDKADNNQLNVVYVYRTDNAKLVEDCMKTLIKSKQYRKYKEVYQIDMDILKDIISRRCGVAAKKLTADYRPNAGITLEYQKKGALSVKRGGAGAGLFAVVIRDDEAV